MSKTTQQLNAEKLAHLSPSEKRALLAELLRERASKSTSLEPMSYGQRALWFLYQLAPENVAYNIAYATSLPADLEITLLQRALEQLMLRHPILRTTYSQQDHAPTQQIHEYQDIVLDVIDASGWNSDTQKRYLIEAAERPFDFRKGPFIRASLLTQANNEIQTDVTQTSQYIFLIVFHHIALDAWSTKLCIQELWELYTAIKSKTPPPPQPKLQYVDYVHWQTEKLSSSAGEQLWQYWKQQLAGELPELNLPTDRPRPPLQTYHGAAHLTSLSRLFSQQLRALAVAEGVTSYTLLLTAFKVLLWRYTQQEKLVIGSPMAGRNLAGLETVLGYFANPVVLRADLAGNPTFSQLLQRLKPIVLAAINHQDYPFPLLVEKLEVARDPSRSPIFQVAFICLEQQSQDTVAVSPVGGSEANQPSSDAAHIFNFDSQRGAAFDLTLTMIQTGQELVANWRYNSDLFNPDTIARMAGHFQTLLQSIVTDPHQTISSLSWLPAAETHQLLHVWNQTQIEYDVKDVCLHQLFEAQVERTPDAIAVVLDDQHLTYRALNQRATQLAVELQTRGVGPEQLVGLCLDRSLDMLVALWGILKAGGAYVPLDPSYPQSRLQFILKDAAVSLVVTQPQFADWLAQQTVDQLYIGDQLSVDPQTPGSYLTKSLIQPSLQPDNLAYVLYTSGSTGHPKGTQISHRGLVNYLYWCSQRYQVAQGTGAPLHSPLGFDATLTSLFAPLIVGQKIVLVPTSMTSDTSPTVPAATASVTGLEALTELLRSHPDFSLVKLTPAHLQVLNQTFTAATKAGQARYLVLGGEELPASSCAAWLEAAPDTHLINEYGPTETVVGCCVHQVTADDIAHGKIPIGRPIANTQLYVLDRDLQPVAIGVPGELHIAGLGLARGYWNHPELTAEKFIPNPFRTQRVGSREQSSIQNSKYPSGSRSGVYKIQDLRSQESGVRSQESGVQGQNSKLKTQDSSACRLPHAALPIPSSRLYKTGDLARYRADGTLEFLGRIDHQVKVRGFRIELGEIESVLHRHDLIQQAVVLARTEANDQKRLVAYLVLEPGNSLTQSELRRYLKQELPDYMVPAVFVLLESLPITPNGKVDRRALPTPNQLRPELIGTFVAPRTPTEVILADIWKQILRIDQVGIHDNFFELGGDSILGMQALSQANNAGLQIALKQLFQYQTIAELAAVAGTASKIQAEQDLVTGDLPLTPIQEWFFAQTLPQLNHWNQSLLIETQHSFNVACLESVLQRLLEHHDALRLGFAQTDSGWQQTNAGTTADLPLTCIDLSALPEPVQAIALASATAQFQGSLNLSHPPLCRVAYFDYGDRPLSQLLIAIHHLAIDGVSWRILLADLQTSYQQLSQGQPIQLPAKTTSFQQWAQRLQNYAPTAAVQSELDHWLAVANQPIAPLPIDFAADGSSANLEASARTLSVSLNATETQTLISQVPKAYNTQINDVLLTALSQALGEWAQTSSLLFNLEGHGREDLFDDLDLSRTVGWFTTIFPVRLDLPSDPSAPGVILQSIKEQLRSIPHRGIGYGLLRYIQENEEITTKLQFLAQPEISFNYLGQFDQTLPGLIPLRLLAVSENTRGPQNPRQHLLDINAVVFDGQLRMDWTYSQQVHRTQTIAALAAASLAKLRSLITHCQSPEAGGYTPSDFPLANLNQDTLNQALASIDLEATVE